MVAGDVHRVFQDYVCSNLDGVELGMQDDPADRQQLVVVIEVPHPDFCELYDIPRKGKIFLRVLSSLRTLGSVGETNPMDTHDLIH